MKNQHLYTKKLSDYGDVLSVKDVQHILDVGRKRVYALIDEKKIYAVRPGRPFCISKKSLISYINGDDKDPVNN